MWTNIFAKNAIFFSVLRIRIRMGSLDLGWLKWPHKNRKMLIYFIFWSAGCSLMRDEGFSCSLDVLYGGPGISKLQFFYQKMIYFIQPYFFQIFGHQTQDLDPVPGSNSVNPDPQHWLFTSMLIVYYKIWIDVNIYYYVSGETQLLFICSIMKMSRTQAAKWINQLINFCFLSPSTRRSSSRKYATPASGSHTAAPDTVDSCRTAEALSKNALAPLGITKSFKFSFFGDYIERILAFSSKRSELFSF